MRTEWLKKRNITNNNTQMRFAKAGEITEEIQYVADNEKRDAEFIRQEVAAGRIAIPANINHKNMLH